MMSVKPRVVILLDLDCFYAQCEIVRLGIDRSTPVALLQVRYEFTHKQYFIIFCMKNILSSHHHLFIYFFKIRCK